jgi:beta-fructofuranosidase
MLPLDYGPDFYAPALLRDEVRNRWLLWGWVPEARTEEWVDEAGWAGMLSLRREIRLIEDGGESRVGQWPARELEALRRGGSFLLGALGKC